MQLFFDVYFYSMNTYCFILSPLAQKNLSCRSYKDDNLYCPNIVLNNTVLYIF